MIHFVIFFMATLSVLATDRYQYITEAEYFVNTDPGVGNGTAIDVSQGFSVNMLIDEIDYSPDDILFVRVKNENDVWSAPFGRKLGNNYIEEVKMFKVTYPVPDYKKEVEIDATVEVNHLNGLISTGISDPMIGDELKPGDTLLVQFKGGNGVWSPKYEVILQQPDLQLAKPLNLQAENVSSGIGVKLTWIDKSDAETEYSIERKDAQSANKKDDNPQAGWTEIAKIDKNNSEFIDKDLDNLTPYIWRVRAIGIKDWMNSQYSNEVELLVMDVPDSENRNSILVYPNPADDIIQIEFPDNIKSIDETLITVHNLLGEVLINKYCNSGGNKIRMNISSLKSGVYLIRAGIRNMMLVKN